MKRFIRYLYEYDQGKRMRNVGFVKVEQGEDDCTLHIHGKGLHMKGERQLALYLFYNENGECVGLYQGTVDNVNPAVNYRLFYTKEDVIAPENFQRINGIVLESETGHKYAAVWNDSSVDVGHMRVLRPEDMLGKETRQSEEPVQGETLDEREEAEQKEVLRQEEEIVPRDMPVTQSEEAIWREEAARESEPFEESDSVLRTDTLQGVNSTQGAQPLGREEDSVRGEGFRREGDFERDNGFAQGAGFEHRNSPAGQQDDMPCTEEAEREDREQSASHEEKLAEADMDADIKADAVRDQGIMDGLQDDMSQDSEKDGPGTRYQCTKIQRNDLARLPRCEWKWANNSFLLHGYYNYHHLALIDDGEKFRLGVPGIYHPQEAKAASVFGFTDFIPYQDLKMDLTDDEKSDQERFGYWSRQVRRPLKM